MNSRTFQNRNTIGMQIRMRCPRGDLKGQLGYVSHDRKQFRSPTNKTRAKRSKIVGRYTQYARLRMIALCINELRALGFKVKYLDNITTRHVRALIEKWDKEGRVTRTIQTRVAAIRMLFAWLERAHVLPANADLLPERHQRATGAAKRDKSWSGNNLKLDEIIKWIPPEYYWVSLSLQLQYWFGLRVNETMLLQPQLADCGTWLFVGWGSKGGRPRVVHISDGQQRELLDRCKQFVAPGEALIGPTTTITRRAARRQYDYVIYDILGISRKSACTTGQGLRNEYLFRQYYRITGERAPIQGGSPVPPELDRAARQYVSELAGHNRVRVASAYLGAVKRGRPPRDPSSYPQFPKRKAGVLLRLARRIKYRLSVDFSNTR